MTDILKRLDDLLEEKENSSDRRHLPKKDVLEILECIKEEVKEDAFLLNVIINDVERNWNISNEQLRESFYKILEGYGIIGESLNRKTILEQKGKTIVRKFVVLKSKNRIKKKL